jgi:hypothetical protein
LSLNKIEPVSPETLEEYGKVSLNIYEIKEGRYL